MTDNADREAGLKAYGASQAEGERLARAGGAAPEVNPAEDSVEITTEAAPEPEASPEASAPEAPEAAESPGEDLSPGDLAAAQEARIAELTEELARANAAYYNKDQEYSNYVRRTKAEIPLYREAGIADVVNSLMGVLDDIALARQHGDLTGPFASVAQNLEDTLKNRFQVTRYGEPGDAFDPNIHNALQMLPGGEEEDTVIVQVAQPGYLQGEKVLRPAQVIVGSAQHLTEQSK